MLLTLDIGNSQVKIGWFDGPRLLDEPMRFSADKTRTLDEWAVLLTGAAQARRLPLPEITDVIIASVVPQITDGWLAVSRRVVGVEAVVVTSRTDTGLSSRYQTQHTLGSDRWVNAFAAHSLHSDKGTIACIVIDFGTATKFEVVAPGGVYLGGAILPGVGISLDALFSRAALLSRIPLDVPAGLPAMGTNTEQALQSGILLGGAALVDGMIARITKELGDGGSGPPVRVIATGGLAPLIVPHTDPSQTTVVYEIVDPHLTLSGLRLLHERQQAQ